MKHHSNSRKSPVAKGVFSILLVQTLLTGQAQAYIDPGSGSFFVQMLVAGLLGAGMVVKSYWQKIKNLFGGSKPEIAQDDSEEQP